MWAARTDWWKERWRQRHGSHRFLLNTNRFIPSKHILLHNSSYSVTYAEGTNGEQREGRVKRKKWIWEWHKKWKALCLEAGKTLQQTLGADGLWAVMQTSVPLIFKRSLFSSVFALLQFVNFEVHILKLKMKVSTATVQVDLNNL